MFQSGRVFKQAVWVTALLVLTLLAAGCQAGAGDAYATQSAPSGQVPVTAASATPGTEAATMAPEATNEAATAAPTAAVEATAVPAATASSSGDDKGNGNDTGYGDDKSAATPVAPATPGAAVPGAAAAPDEVKLTVREDPALGKFLADEKGMTLYLFTKDTPGKSVCEGKCLEKWPALLIAKGGKIEIDGMDETSKLGTVTRSDGSTQVAYGGMPLYYWVNDSKPGDVTGHGVGGVWYVVKP